MIHRLLPLGVATATAVALTVIPMAPAASAATQVTRTFLHNGAEQTFTVPAGVTSVRLFAYGGRGGNSASTANGIKPGGWGAAVFATFPVVPGQVLYVNVGGAGANATAAGGAGGFNGGGGGGPYAGGGGGATDVRTTPRAQGQLGSRLIVAGGGGGGAASPGPSPNGSGGPGGTLGGGFDGGSGGDGCSGGKGGWAGTQATGGAGGAGAARPPSSPAQTGGPGVLGSGGAGGRLDDGAGGGGGGYYGGGGGGAGRLFTGPICWGYPGGGGGGSSFTAPSATSVTTTSPSDLSSVLSISYELPPTPPPPPPPPGDEKASTVLKISAQPKRDRKAPYVYRVNGKVTGAFSVNAASCRGQVRFTVKRASRVLARSATQLSSTCGIQKRVRITRARLGTGKSVRLSIKVRFAGNARLQPSQRTVWVRAN